MNVLLITSDKKEAKYCEQILLEMMDELEEIHTAVSDKEAIKHLKNNEETDIVFLWTNINNQSGFDIVEQSKTKAVIVFIAGDEQLALKVFQFNTLDYLIAPIEKKQLSRTIKKYNKYFKNQSEVGYMRNLQSLMMSMSRKEKEYKKRFMVKIGNTIKSVAVEDVAYFFTLDRVNYLVQFNGKKFPIDNTLDEVETLLNPEEFFRANRQFMVNINAISEIHPYFKGRVKINLNPIQDGDIVISSEKSRSFKEWLDE